MNLKLIALIENFRKFYADLISQEFPDRTATISIDEPEQSKLSFLAHLFDRVWRGLEFSKEELSQVYIISLNKLVPKFD